MKKIALCFGGVTLFGPPLDSGNIYLQSYLEIGRLLRKQDVELYAVRGLMSYLGGNSFEAGAIYRNGRFEEYPERIDADLIYCKSDAFYPDSTATILNEKEFDVLFNNKMYMAAVFPQLFPKSIRVQEQSQIEPLLGRLATNRVVAKPIDGYGGSGIFIGTKEEVASKIETFPYLIQEFVDTSMGIPGLTQATSDLRVIVTGTGDRHRIILMYYREPPPGSLITNFQRGGTMVMVQKPQWPAGAVKLVQQVDERFRRFNKRIYCLDCARRSDGTWIIFEINVPPGQMMRDEMGTEADGYFEGVTEVLLA